jgi:hypothetical protein
VEKVKRAGPSRRTLGESPRGFTRQRRRYEMRTLSIAQGDLRLLLEFDGEAEVGRGGFAGGEGGFEDP